MGLGTFEWCLPNIALEQVIKPLNLQQLLVVGCGTSKVEELLQWVSFLYCVDNDSEVIKEQEERLKNYKAIEFEVLDLCIPNINCLLRYGRQHAILDKGTLDYLLCQDPLRCAQMLRNLQNTLHINGKYILVTIQPPKLVLAVVAVYGFECIQQNIHPGCVSFILNKVTDDLRSDYLTAHSNAMDQFAQQENPLPTTWNSTEQNMDLIAAYKLAIGDELKTEYSYDMFIEDLSNTHTECIQRDMITVQELQEFIQINQ